MGKKIAPEILLAEGLQELVQITAARAAVKKKAEERGTTPAAMYEEAWRRRRAKTLAGALGGLAYWPALAYGPRIDPAAYRAAEQVLARKAGALWGEMTPAGRSHGGWDSWGHHGTSPDQVAKAWFAAGCRDTTKFRLQIAAGIVAKKGDSVPFFQAFVKGLRWAKAHRQAYLGRKALAALGRLPWYCRWAAVRGAEEAARAEAGPDAWPVVIRIRHLNWAAVAVAQKGPRAAIVAGLAPNRWAWEETLPGVYQHLPAEERARSPYTIPQGTVRALLGESPAGPDVLPALRIAALFGRDLAAARRYVAAFEGEGGGAVHAAGQFTLPPEGWTRQAWAGLASRYPAAIREWLPVGDVIEGELGRPPEDMAEIRATAARQPHLLARVAGLFLGSAEMADYQALWGSPKKGWEEIPAPGGNAGLRVGGVTVRQLGHDDLTAALAGRLVNCCQHLHGAAASCARATWTQPACAIWAAYVADRMVAQAFVWRSHHGGDLVLDSVEALASGHTGVAAAFRAAAHAVLGRLGVRRVLVGVNGYGVSREVAASGDAEPAPEPAFLLGYTDAHTVRVVAEASGAAIPGAMVAGAVAAAFAEAAAEVGGTAVGGTNVLMAGSGVVCEHCDAEVHPDCEICPCCGQDIAEWVD
jgi:hypothetical protein